MAERKIGTRTFKTDKLLATRAVVLQARVFKVIGPGLAHMGDVLREAKGKDEVGAGALGALAEVFAKSEPEALAALLKDVVELAQIKRPSGIYENCDLDGDFTTNPQDLYPVALFVIKEQLGDFFTGDLGLSRLLKRVVG